jgi:hypothetical protein
MTIPMQKLALCNFSVPIKIPIYKAKKDISVLRFGEFILIQPEGGAPGTQPAGQPPNSQMPGGQAYQYSYPNYYGGQGQPPSGMPNQNYGGYPAYGGYGGQPQGPEN